MSEQNYYDTRLQKIGITEENNAIELLFATDENGKQEIDSETTKWKEYRRPVQIFRKHEKGIEIIAYNLKREQIRIEKDGTKQKRDWSIIRLEHPKGDMKYVMPKGHGSYPFIPPALLDKFDKRDAIPTLYLTEGFFKAFKGSLCGLNIIGLVSITHMKDKVTGALHPDILEIIQKCDVKRVVWLTDGDCFDLSSKALDPNEKVDLYKRPASFYSSVVTFKQLLDDYPDVDKFFAYIDIDNIITEKRSLKSDVEFTRSDIKGLDDLLIMFPENQKEIIDDLNSVSKNGTWFQAINISFGLSKTLAAFRLKSPLEFYLYHLERKELVPDREFIFNGTKYKYDTEKGEVNVVVPGEANDYFRVQTTYYKFVHIPNKYKQLERSFVGWDKGTIIDDHGKDFIKHIAKYQAFCNVPDHINHQQVINSCFNVYSPLDFQPADEECTTEDCPTIMLFLRHIFGTATVPYVHPKTKEKIELTMEDMGLDYVQILYQRPADRLPILCLVSKENNTGKSTFGKLMKVMLSGNCAIVGNQDLAGEFNKHWSTKALVVCDETKIDKQAVVEKVKSLSFADKIMMNSKGKDHVEIDCFLKFVFITNNENNFISASEEDQRYWILKVPILKHDNPSILEQMIDEMPAFLAFLNKRKLKTERVSRMWFHESLLRTAALKKVQQHSLPTVVKEIITHIRDMFFEFGVDEILMTKKAVKEEFLRGRFEDNYIEDALKDHLRLELKHEISETEKDLFGDFKKIYKTYRHSYPKWEYNALKNEKIPVLVNDNGRPYVFKPERFLDAYELTMYKTGTEAQYVASMIANPGSIPAVQGPGPPTSTELPF